MLHLPHHPHSHTTLHPLLHTLLHNLPLIHHMQYQCGPACLPPPPVEPSHHTSHTVAITGHKRGNIANPPSRQPLAWPPPASNIPDLRLLHPVEFWCRGSALAKPVALTHYHTHASSANLSPMARGLYAPFPRVLEHCATTSSIYPHHLRIVDVVLHAHQTPQAGIVVWYQSNTCCALADFQCPMVAAVLL